MGNRRSTSTSCPSVGQITSEILFSWLAAWSTIPAIVATSWAGGWLDSANQNPFVSTSPLTLQDRPATVVISNQNHDFTLSHIFEHGVYEYQPLQRRMDLRPSDLVWALEESEEARIVLGVLHARSSPTTIQRLSDRSIARVQSTYHTARVKGTASKLDFSQWTMDEVLGPNVTDKETVLSLAKMSWNAYTEVPGAGEWQDVNTGFNHSQGFGWEGDSLRGHVYVDKHNSTVIISLKGTSPGKP